MTDIKKGDRVKLVRTTDPHARLEPGDEGTVRSVRTGMDGAEYGINWDDGSSLTMIPDLGDVIARA